MQSHADPLKQVVAELERRLGDLPRVAKDSGIAYDTILRIKNGENDPGYSKVLALHKFLFAKPAARAKPALQSPRNCPDCTTSRS